MAMVKELAGYLEPTWTNQVRMARQLLAEQGIEELYRHALVALRHGCKCRECFCCAAAMVHREATQRERE